MQLLENNLEELNSIRSVLCLVYTEISVAYATACYKIEPSMMGIGYVVLIALYSKSLFKFSLSTVDCYLPLSLNMGIFLGLWPLGSSTEI